MRSKGKSMGDFPTAILLDAQEHPENYPNLAVRVSGWCARFNTLTKEWQDMVIQRTQQFI